MNNHVKASAPYSRRPPSPPAIAIPAVLSHKRRGTQAELVMVPSYENVDPEQLTEQDLATITGHQTRLTGVESATNWAYEQRREAQRILDFLYLGPNNVIRDLDYLREQGITMIIVLRDSRLAGRPLQSLEAATTALGIEGMYVDVASDQQLIHGFSDTVRSINNHLLSVVKNQAHKKTEDGQMMLDADTKGGKVLVAYQSGNDVAPVVVAAYMMAALGKDVATVVQFVCAQRFCCVFDENRKRLLMSWQDILRARAQVARARSPWTEGAAPAAAKSKRGFEDVVMDEGTAVDQERFLGREDFVPFADVDG